MFNLEAAANETFRYSATLQNGSGESRYYALNAKLPAGWFVTFRTMGSQVTSLLLEAGKSQEVSIEINASPYSKPGKFEIPVTATSAKDTLRLNLEAVLKGAYGIELTTPSGRLSEDVTEGSVEEIICTIKNTGTLPLENVELTAQTPPKWEVTFQPSKVERIDPAGSVDITATVRVPDKTIAGDYVSTFTARNQNTSANASFRIMVKTSLLSGWFGILVILLAVGLVYQLIRKYGRR
ncbi:NEW3 domain-containing protein [Dyadobacter sp. 676]|uniref:NEW3 domain-containing protein n=1 Tax=Dyadobacter sp. 676 TaxID=3088362 RepID=A0AAU8FL24_9BACT